MAIYKRRGSSFYWMKFEFNGTPYQRTTGSKNKAAAQKIEAKFRTDLALGIYGLQPMKPGPRFKDYAEQFHEFVETHSAGKPATIAMYANGMKRLLTFGPLADRRLNLMDEALVEDYIRHQRKRLAIATVNGDLRVLRRALKIARKPLGLMTTVVDIRALSGEHKRDFVLSYEQEAAYLAACSDLLRDAAMLMLDTGLRVGECVTVRWSDFNPDRTRLDATDAARFSPRTLGVSVRCRDMLAFRRRMFPETDYVFTGRFPGAHLGKGSLQEMHVIARRNARLGDGSELPAEFVIHSMRHTFGTRFGESEPNAFLVKEAMGHGDVSVSQLYVHAQQAAMTTAFERLDNMNRLMRGEETGRDKNRDSAILSSVKR